MTFELWKAGVPLMAGSDSPTNLAWQINQSSPTSRVDNMESSQRRDDGQATQRPQRRADGAVLAQPVVVGRVRQRVDVVARAEGRALARQHRGAGAAAQGLVDGGDEVREDHGAQRVALARVVEDEDRDVAVALEVDLACHGLRA